MKKLLPFLLIILGLAEIILALTGIQMPLPTAILLGVLFIGLGIKTLLDASKKE